MIHSKSKVKNHLSRDQWKCGKTLTKSDPRHHSQNGSYKSMLLKVFLLVLIIIWISGTVSASSVTKNTLNDSKIKNTTVYVEDGFSGNVTIKDPLLNKTVNVTIKYSPYCSGSGFIVSKKGYIITAFHVVSDSNTLEYKNKLKKMNSSDIKWYVEELGLMNYLENNDTELYYQLFRNVPRNEDAFNKAIENVTNSFIKKGWLSSSYYENDIYAKGSALKTINASGILKASLIDFGNCKNDEDIALLKINTNGKNLPALTISAESPKKGTKVYIYGYPYNKGNNVASKSSGHLIEKILNPKGIVYYRTSAITEEGCSGSPAVNSQNKVIGVLIYGIYSGEGRFQKNIGSLFLSANYIQKICKKNKVPIKVA